MIAVIVSLILVLYVLVPGGIFRLVTSLSLPLKKFNKSRTQEITFAVVSCLLPFVVTLALMWLGANWPFPTRESSEKRKEAYRTFFLAMDSDKQLDAALQGLNPAHSSQATLWPAVNSVLKRQGRFVFWYYILVMVEAGGFSWLAAQYRREGKDRWRDRIASRILPPSISEWHVLLTNFGSPGPERKIMMDVLTVDGILYQGELRDYFFNVDGELAGVLLSKARRFDLWEYKDHRLVDLQRAARKRWPGQPVYEFTQQVDQYWRKIPGADLFYIPQGRISNVNVRHVPDNVAEAAEERLAARNIKDLDVLPPAS